MLFGHLPVPRPGGFPDRLAYRAQQASLFHLFKALHRRWGVLCDSEESQAGERALSEIWRRYLLLLERDLSNVQAEMYPRELLFEIPFGHYLKMLPAMVRNTPRVTSRRAAGDFMDLPAGVDLERYPDYYRRNFHWQTDGYLSRRSAELYDLGVEMLFLGVADVMRRQTIPPITRFLRARGNGPPARVLDVGCGTARTLLQIALAHPAVSIAGVDLSPYYVDVAKETLDGLANVSLMAANAEELPFRDGHFDIALSVFTFHELPKPVRTRVLEEMRRVLRPGGLLVIEDSAQLSDASELSFFMDRFAAEFHEPYYADYVAEDLAASFEACGFGVERVETCFVAKVVSGRKR